MKTIWKYPILIVDDLTIEMPKGAEILTVQQQHGITCIWALVDSEAEKEKRIFEINGTGMPIPCGNGIERKYIGTFLIYDDNLVFHLFERIK